MDDDLKIMLGRILGEIFRTQKRIEPTMCNVNDARIYGLLNGIESVINEFTNQNLITNDDEYLLSTALQPYFENPNEFKGYYRIERDLAGRDQEINRGTAITLLKYYKAIGSFSPPIEIIEKKIPGENPIELERTFDIDPSEV